MPSQEDWFLGEHYVDAEIACLPHEVPKSWRHDTRFGRAKGMPELTPEEELIEMDKQIESSQGFDIDFRKFACLFNYRPVELHYIDCCEKPPTSISNVLKRLSKKRLKDYNKDKGKSFKFVKIVKANYFPCVGRMYFITFEVIDPFDNQRKLFQVKVNYFYSFATNYYLCRPKPNQKLACIGTLRPQGEYELRNSGTHTKALSPVETAKPTRKVRSQTHNKTRDGLKQSNNHVMAGEFRPNRFDVLANINN